jgi:hypothetical protein
MQYGDIYIPDLIAGEIFASTSGPYSGRAVPNIKKVTDINEPPVAAPPEPPKSDPTTTILWIGALTSVGGLGIQFADYMGKKKR